MKSRRGLTAGFGAIMMATTALFASTAPSAFTQTGPSSVAGYDEQVQCVQSCRLSVSFTVPSVQCPSANTQMALFGGRFVTVAGQTTTPAKPYIRIFPIDLQGGVLVECRGINTPVFQTVFQFTTGRLYGKTPHAGDSMTIILNVKTPGAATGASIKIRDITRSWTQTMYGETGAVSSVQAELKAFGCVENGACWPVPEFTSPVQFSQVSFNGGLAQYPAWQPLSIIDLASEVEASSSAPPLTPDGTFSVSWVFSCSPGVGGKLC